MTADQAKPADPTAVAIPQLKKYVGETVTLKGWVDKRRSSGKIGFVHVRDSGLTVQVVISRADVDERSWEEVQRVTQESTVEVVGVVSEDARSPMGVEIQAASFRVIDLCEDYPITPKDHGTAFLMEHRHLWLRSSKPRATLMIRSEATRAIRDFFYDRGYHLIDSPILTPAACEGTSTLFSTDYFGDPAFLSQSGQLYLEPAAAALGKVFCFGPTFRAEKSKTRRHLMEFWMVEPEVAFLQFKGLCELAEEFLVAIVSRVLENCQEPLRILERDLTTLEGTANGSFPRIRYSEAIEQLQAAGSGIQDGDDFGAEDETLLAAERDRPLLVTHYPTDVKAFYMEPDPEDGRYALALDVIAPEGYGEIIGGSERINDHDLLLERIRQHDLPQEAFQWYLDVRKYGTFPHSGFGMGLERFVAWMSGAKHLRETIPYPRMLYKIYP